MRTYSNMVDVDLPHSRYLALMEWLSDFCCPRAGEVSRTAHCGFDVAHRAVSPTPSHCGGHPRRYHPVLLCFGASTRRRTALGVCYPYFRHRPVHHKCRRNFNNTDVDIHVSWLDGTGITHTHKDQRQEGKDAQRPGKAGNRGRSTTILVIP